MPRLASALPVALFTLLLAGSCRFQAAARRESSVVEELSRLERDIGAANVRRDRAFFDRVEAADFVFTSPAGAITTKQEDLADLDSPSPTKLVSYDVDDLRVRVYDSVAVVLGRVTTASTRSDGTSVGGRGRFTDVFVWRDGRWQLVAGHSSRLPADRR